MSRLASLERLIDQINTTNHLLRQMAAWPPSSGASNASHGSSPVDYDDDAGARSAAASLHMHESGAEAQSSPFLALPIDIFKCVTDYLDRDAAWSLKRVCRGMSRSTAVDEVLYRYPIQSHDVSDIRLSDWTYRAMGRQRWVNFQSSINDSNRRFVQRLAMSHWCSVADFEWMQDNLPALTSLDLSAIKDFVWTPAETWTWKELAAACPRLFSRIEELEVVNWSDYTSHQRIEYSYAYSDYRFKQDFRLSRRRDGGSVAKLIFPMCTKLRTLAIRGRCSGYQSWNEKDVHQQVCVAVDGIEKHCPPTLKKLRVYTYASFRYLFLTDASKWKSLGEVEIDLYSWMEDRRDRDLAPGPQRIMPGASLREDEEAFDDKTFDTCERQHLQTGQRLVNNDRATVDDLLQTLHKFTQNYPHILIKPISKLRDVALHPLHLVNVYQRRRHTFLHHFGVQHQQQQQHHHQQQQHQQNVDRAPPNPIISPEAQSVVRWLVDQCDWKPIMVWNPLMCDVFPSNLDYSGALLPKEHIMSRIQAMVLMLKSLGVPLRVSIGNLGNICDHSTLDGPLLFSDYKCFTGESDERRELLAPTQARFNLSAIAPLVDELTIIYHADVPGVGDWRRGSCRRTEAEIEALRKEMKGWRRFLARYALLFKNLKKLKVTVPSDIYSDWGKSEYIRKLLTDERWDVVDVGEILPLGFSSMFDSYTPLSHLRYSIAKEKTRTGFVRRVFFRADKDELPLEPLVMTDNEREDGEIPDEALDTEDLPPHRFWPAGATKGEKRKLDEDELGEMPAAKVARAA